jgi:flagellar motor switch protein FliN
MPFNASIWMINPLDSPLKEATFTMSYPYTEVPQSHKDSLWDKLHVDVHAEFPPMRVPLKELRHMNEGLLVEVGDLLQHDIKLISNGSIIALGQLVVVGDKFGVLVTEVPNQLKANADIETAPIQVLESHENRPISMGEASSNPPQQPQPNQVASGATPPTGDPILEFSRTHGLHPVLARTASEVGFNLNDLVQAAKDQNVAVNDFFMAAFEQNNIPIPELQAPPPVEDINDEIERTSQMMDEVEDLFNNSNTTEPQN